MDWDSLFSKREETPDGLLPQQSRHESLVGALDILQLAGQSDSESAQEIRDALEQERLSTLN